MSLVNSEPQTPGWKAKDFRLNATDGYEYALRAFSDKKSLLVIFTCNHCPYAKAAWPIFLELFKKYDKNVGIVAINPNDESAHPDDSFEKMQKLVNKMKIPFPYLHDKEQEIAKAYNAQCTPEVYLFSVRDVSFSLYYHGRINDNWRYPKKVKEHSLENAIKGLLSGKQPPEEQLPSMGCSIKWK